MNSPLIKLNPPINKCWSVIGQNCPNGQSSEEVKAKIKLINVLIIALINIIVEIVFIFLIKFLFFILFIYLLN